MIPAGRLILVFAASLCRLFAGEMEFTFEVDENGEPLPSSIFKGAANAYNLNMKGLAALEKNNYEEALVFFENAFSALPNYSDALNNIGVVYYRKGSIGLACETWGKVLHIDPEYSIAYYNLGVSAHSEHKYETAKQYFRKALDKNKRFIEAAVMMGRTEYASGNSRGALDYMEKAFKISPANKDAWSNYAFMLIQQNDTAQAQKLLAKYRNNAYACRLLGEIEAVRGRTAGALKYLNEAYTISGNYALLLEIAQVQYTAKQFMAALSTITTYMTNESHPTDDAWLLAGTIAKECGNNAQAERFFEDGLAQYPNDQLLRFNLGQIYFSKKQYGNADRVWEGMQDTLHDPSLYFLRALSAKKQKNLNEALQHIQRALSLDPKPEYLDLFGVILYEKGKKDEAAQQFRKALAINPAFQSAQLNLAICEKNEKNLTGAISALKKKAETCRDDCAEEALQLSVLYYNNRQYDLAIKTLLAIPESQRELRTYRYLAVYYRNLADWTKSIEILEKAQKLFTLDQQTEYELAQSYVQAGLYSKAISLLNSLARKWEANQWRIYYELGYAYVQLNELMKAKEFLDKSLSQKRDYLAAQGLLGYVYNALGDAKKAQTLWEQNLSQDAGNDVLWINMGLSLEVEGKYEQSLEKYQKALSIAPDKRAVHINMGNVYAAMDKNDKALAAYEKALNSDKREIAAYNVFITAKKSDNRRKADEMVALLQKEYGSSIWSRRAAGEMLLWKGDTAAASRAFESLPEKNEYDWCALASVYLAQCQGSQAEAALSHLPQAPQWNDFQKQSKARIAYCKGNYDEAFLAWKEQGSSDFNTKYNLALTAYTAGKYPAAIEFGQKIVEEAVGEDKINLCRMIGNSAVKLKDWKTSRSWFLQLVGYDQDDAISYYNIAVADYNLGDMEEAWKYYQEARNLKPSIKNADIEKRYAAFREHPTAKVVFDPLDTLYNMAVSLQQKGDTQGAKKIYRRIVEKDTTYYRAWNNLGTIYGAEGELESAIGCYKKVVAQKEDIPDGYANLANIYMAMENYKEARKWLLKGRMNVPDNEILAQIEKKLQGKKN